ncbi:MAG: hypothetical protein KZY74_18615 [Paenibacillaceae bacterium]|nr:hypothetical protein [Paenibacillaceae bacterium]
MAKRACERRLIVVMCSLTMIFVLSGCWNYREVDKMTTVAGIAIDKGEKEGEIRLTVEVVDGLGGKDAMSIGSSRISLSGHTMFEIVRRMITESGNRLYWAHAKSIILSEEIARDGAAKVIDWYVRDSETRSDIHILVSGEETAEEVLSSKSNSTRAKRQLRSTDWLFSISTRCWEQWTPTKPNSHCFSGTKSKEES